MRRRVVTIFLDEILVLENGRADKDESENVVIVNLIWPRPMIDIRSAAKTVRLEDGARTNFAASPFFEKILFKEIVSGPFGITVEVTERQSPGIIAQFLSGIAPDLVTAAIPLPAAGEPFRRIVRVGVSGAGEKWKYSTKDQIIRIAFGHGVIDPQTATSGRLELPMIAPETIDPGGSTGRTRRPPVLVKGQPNGQAILRYGIEDD